MTARKKVVGNQIIIRIEERRVCMFDLVERQESAQGRSSGDWIKAP